MVFDLSLSAGSVMGSGNPDYSITEWGSNWPGNNAGCYCSSSNEALEVSQGLHVGSCNGNQTEAGCNDIEARNPQMMSKWTATDTVYAARGKGTSFLASYKRMDPTGKCESGFKRCGNINSKSKGICIPSKFSTCPLTDVRATAADGYSLVTIPGGARIYFGSSDTANSISELMIVQHHACFIRSQLGYTPGRSVYKLLRGNYEDCSPDNNVMYLHEIGEQDLINFNKVNVSHLLEFSTNNNFKYKLSAARYIDWSIDCSDVVETIGNKQNDLQKLSKDFLLLFILYIISFSLSCLVFLLRGQAFLMEKTKYYKWMLFVRICLWLMIVPSMFICFIGTYQFTSYFKNISDLGCSDKETNAQFDNLSNQLRTKLGTKIYLYLIMSIVGMAVEVGMGILDLCFIGTGIAPVVPESKPEESGETQRKEVECVMGAIKEPKPKFQPPTEKERLQAKKPPKQEAQPMPTNLFEM